MTHTKAKRAHKRRISRMKNSAMSKVTFKTELPAKQQPADVSFDLWNEFKEADYREWLRVTELGMRYAGVRG